MLDEEQEKTTDLRKQLQSMHGAADCLSVLNTLVDLPGVSPEHLIEIMCGKIISTQSDVKTAKSIAAQAQSEVTKLKRTIHVLTQSHAERSVSPFRENTKYEESIDPRFNSDRGPEIPDNPKLNLKLKSKGVGQSRLHGVGYLVKDENWAGGMGNIGRIGNVGIPGGDEDEEGGMGVGGGVGGGGGVDMSALSLVVDGETTPQVLLDSLNAATMAMNMRSQAMSITSLRKQLEEAHEGILHAESSRLSDVDELESRSKIEIDNAQRRIGLLQGTLEDNKEEINKLRERNKELENNIIISQTASFQDPVKNNPLGVSDFMFRLSQLTGDCQYDSSQTIRLPDESKAELDHVKSILRERTAQLKILMETLDSLQESGVGSGPGLGRGYGRDARTGIRSDVRSGGVEYEEDSLFDLAAAPLRHEVEGGRGSQGLVKRVVELTAEVSSHSAAAAMEERRANYLETQNMKLMREINRLKATLKEGENTKSTIRLHLNSLGEQIIDAEKRRSEECSAARMESEQLMNALKQSESQVASLSVTVDELRQQNKLSENIDVKQWLEGVITRDKSICDSHVDALHAHTRNTHRDSMDRSHQANRLIVNASGMRTVQGTSRGSACGSVKELVLGLLEQWAQEVGGATLMRPDAAIGGGGRRGKGEEGLRSRSLNKAEQRFYQRVADLAMAADEKANRCIVEARDAEVMRVKAELSLKVCQDRLTGCVLHLNRYRKRAYACEHSARTHQRLQALTDDKLTSLLNKSLSEQRYKVAALNNEILAERKARQISETSKSVTILQLRQVQHRVAELEFRGGDSLKGRDEALIGVEDRIKAAEEGYHTWFSVELPRLLQGLPLEEVSMANFFDTPYAQMPHTQYSGGGDMGGLGGLAGSGPGSGQGSGSGGFSEGKEFESTYVRINPKGLGSTSTYALAQTLCVCKASQSAQDMRISNLLEKNYVLKEKAMEMQGVLTKWGGDIEATAEHLARCEEEWNAATTGTTRTTRTGGQGTGAVVTGSISKVTDNIDGSTKIAQLQQELMTSEGKKIELQGELDRALSQVTEQCSLLDLLTGKHFEPFPSPWQ